MNLEVFRELDMVWIRDLDTDHEWPLPAEVWVAVHQPIIDLHSPHMPMHDFAGYCSECSDSAMVDYPCPTLRLLMLPPVWGQTPAPAYGAPSARDNPDRRATP